MTDCSSLCVSTDFQSHLIYCIFFLLNVFPPLLLKCLLRIKLLVLEERKKSGKIWMFFEGVMNTTTCIKPPAKLSIKEQWKVKAKAKKAPALSKNLGIDLWRFPRAGAVLLMHISSNTSAWIWSLGSGL